MEALEKIPPRDPEFARTLTVIAIDVLRLRLSRRGAVPMSRLGTRLQQAVAELSPDDPLRMVGETMVWATVFARGVTEHRPELSQQAIEALIRIADEYPGRRSVPPVRVHGRG